MPFQTQAQLLLDGHLLGLTEVELQASVATLQKVRKPSLGPRGLRGLWSLPNTQMAGLPLETIFFIADKKVQRIEQRASPSERECKTPSAIPAIFTALDSKYGASLSALDTDKNGPSRQSKVWEAGDFDVVGHFSQSPPQCTLLLIYKWHAEKDASTL